MKVRLTTSEMRIEADRVTPNSTKNLPMIPPIRMIGANTATREMEMEITVNDTSCAPSRAAWKRGMPSST